eukprot:PhF_6_TR44243/c1_g1_i3/m.68047
MHRVNTRSIAPRTKRSCLDCDASHEELVFIGSHGLLYLKITMQKYFIGVYIAESDDTNRSIGICRVFNENRDDSVRMAPFCERKSHNAPCLASPVVKVSHLATMWI